MTSRLVCQVVGCRRKVVTSFGTTINGLRVCWYACDQCAKAHNRNAGKQSLTVSLVRRVRPEHPGVDP